MNIPKGYKLIKDNLKMPWEFPDAESYLQYLDTAVKKIRANAAPGAPISIYEVSPYWIEGLEYELRSYREPSQREKAAAAKRAEENKRRAEAKKAKELEKEKAEYERLKKKFED